MDDHIVIHSFVKHPVAVALYETENQESAWTSADLRPAAKGEPVVFEKIPVPGRKRDQPFWTTIEVNPSEQPAVTIDQVLVMPGQRIKISPKFNGFEVEVN